MKIFAAGVRGSAVVADPAAAEYGGDTTCFVITADDGTCIIMDTGSGLRSIPDDGSEHIRIVMSHYHLDHLVGLPAFQPLYAAGTRIEICGPDLGGATPESVMHGIMRAPFWPVPAEDLAAEITFTTLPACGEDRRGGLRLRWCPVAHPGGCAAYRFDDAATGRAAVIATDVEWPECDAQTRAAFMALCTEPGPADVLIMDGQYGDEDYPAHRGWGHSPRGEVIGLARELGIASVSLTHHDPRHNDVALAAIDREVQDLMPGAGLLRQGQTLALD